MLFRNKVTSDPCWSPKKVGHEQFSDTNVTVDICKDIMGMSIQEILENP
jgi:hypothetical protein